jgi:hypothetical protein
MGGGAKTTSVPPNQKVNHAKKLTFNSYTLFNAIGFFCEKVQFNTALLK